MDFRPCIDIHNGKVKQIVGGSLKDRGDQAMENYRELTRRNYTPEEWSTFKDTLQGFFLNLVDIMEMPDDRLVPDPALKTPLKPGPAPERRDEHRDSPPDGVRGEHSQPKE